MVNANGFTSCLLILLLAHAANGWVWVCASNGYCNRQYENSIEFTNSSTVYYSQSSCRLVCGNDGIVWPKPSSYNSTAKHLIRIDPNKINVTVTAGTAGQKFLEKSKRIFLRNLNRDNQVNTICEGTNYDLNIVLQAVSDDLILNWDTDESYSLQIETNDLQRSVTARLTATTVFGARHALETLLQLIVSFEIDGTTCLATIQHVDISDQPVYRHRGLLLDTARNFLSLKMIKKNIIGMAASKLNFLHWHITDSQSFPFQSTRLPNMTRYGAFSEKEIYTPEDVKSIKDFALERGIRVMLEIDAPAHTGNGWQWTNEAGLGNLALCVNKQPWRTYCVQPPCGQLNPANQNLYTALGSLYQDIVDIFPESNAFHMGGDEVKFACWNTTKEVIDYVGVKHRSVDDFIRLWAEFQNKSAAAYDLAVGHNNSKLIVWTSNLTEPANISKLLPKDRYVIQSWEFSYSVLPFELLLLGYHLIISTKDKWYLDRGFWGETTFAKWTDVYDNEIPTGELVLGGEVCMWGELVDDMNVLPRVWPRAAAAGERLWSNPSTNAELAKDRFFLHVERLRKRGIDTEGVTSKYCVQNEGLCRKYL